MGCFNTKGWFTHLPITGGDKVFMNIVIYCTSHYESDNTPCDKRYQTGALHPICFPLIGEYDDYGKIDNIERDVNVEAIEKFFGTTIERFIEVLDDNTNCYRVHDYDGEPDPERLEYEHYKELLGLKKNDEHYQFSDKDELMFTMDHYCVYDAMVKRYQRECADGYTRSMNIYRELDNEEFEYKSEKCKKFYKLFRELKDGESEYSWKPEFDCLYKFCPGKYESHLFGCYDLYMYHLMYEDEEKFIRDTQYQKLLIEYASYSKFMSNNEITLDFSYISSQENPVLDWTYMYRSILDYMMTQKNEYESWDKYRNIKYDEFDKECVDLCKKLNMLPNLTTVESCCGHLKEPYMIWFSCDNQSTVSRLSRVINKNYSDGNWEIVVDCSDANPVNGFLLRSKKVFESEEEMNESIKNFIEAIDYWFDKKFDDYFSVANKIDKEAY